MPAGRGSQTIGIGQTANVEAMNLAALPRGGELGQAYGSTSGKYYQLVQLDSGATAATPTGVVAAGDLAYWMTRGALPASTNPYRVTNDIRVALGAEDATQDNKRNFVAGVFTGAITPGNYCVIQQQGYNAAVKSDGGADFTVGDQAVAANTTASDIDRVAAGTAPGWTSVGYVAAAESGGFTAMYLNLPVVP